ncbi:hypothetical protein P5W99_31200 [Paraburkholderia sp. A3BS-1L]
MTLQDILRPAQLFIDYALEVAPESDQVILEEYACRWGNAMLNLA